MSGFVKITNPDISCYFVMQKRRNVFSAFFYFLLLRESISVNKSCFLIDMDNRMEGINRKEKIL